MTVNDSQYYIYLRSTKERIPCTKEEFEIYSRNHHAFRMREQRRGYCVCPMKKEFLCDMVCVTCPFHVVSICRKKKEHSCNRDCTTCPIHKVTLYSLDATVTDDAENETTWKDLLADSSPLISELAADTERMTQLFIRLDELMPQAIEIGKLRLQGFSDEAIAEQIGIGRKTFAYRLKKVKDILSKEFAEFF